MKGLSYLTALSKDVPSLRVAQDDPVYTHIHNHLRTDTYIHWSSLHHVRIIENSMATLGIYIESRKYRGMLTQVTHQAKEELFCKHIYTHVHYSILYTLYRR